MPNLALYFAFIITLAFSMTLGDSVANTPPMGWNSYDAWLGGISETPFRQGAQVMNTKLKSFGWSYVVIDAGWYTAEGSTGFATDGHSRAIPVESKWPSAAKGVGFKAVADFVHSLGLKFGIHVMRGINQDSVERNEPIFGSKYFAQDIALKQEACTWYKTWIGVNMTHPGGKDFYKSIVDQYASWGVDFIKNDCMFPKYTTDIIAMSEAINSTGRDILYSLSPGGGVTPEDAQKIKSYANMYRITNDLWDCWNDTNDVNPFCNRHGYPSNVINAMSKFPQFSTLAGDDGLNGKSWPDGDMLPLGYISQPGTKDHPHRTSSLTLVEQRTLMTLWCIVRAPLIFGGDLLQLDDFTLSLLTNPEVIRVNQESFKSMTLWKDKVPNIQVWKGVHQQGDIFVALFNTGEEISKYDYSMVDLGLPAARPCSVRDLWLRKDEGNISNKYSITINPHGARLFSFKC